jgi:hypothetical protein
MNKQDFERLLSGEYLSGQASAAAPVGRSGYATERAMKDTVRRTDAEMAADTATNQNPAVFAELEREYQNAKDPSIKAILAEEIRRQHGVAPSGFAQPASVPGQDVIAPSVRSSAGMPDFAGNQKRRDAQAKADASPVSTSLGRGWERTKQMAGDTWNLATDNAEGVRQNALEWEQYDKENPAPSKSVKFNEEFSAAGDSVGGMLGAVARNPGGFGLASVEQITNSLPSMAGSIAGSAIGATKGFGMGGPWGALAGSIVGGIAGSSPGSFMIEPGAKVAGALAESGVDIANPDAVKNWFSEHRPELIEKGLIKAGTVSAFDGLIGGVGQAIVMKPALRFAQAQNNALRRIGVDATDSAAVAAARQTDAYKSLMAQPAQEFIAASTVAQKAMRGMAAFGAETYGEFGGEYYGEMLAEGEGNFNEAMLEAISAGATSVATTAAQFGASKAIFGPDQSEIEIRELASFQSQQQQAQQQAQQPQPNSPLSNAAAASQPVDPLAEMLAPITERLSDREIYAKIRGTESLGPDALSDILASYRVATNTNADPMQRQAAITRLGEFFTAFDNMGPGFPEVPGTPGAVGFVNPASSNASTAEQSGAQRRLPHNPDASAIDGQSRVIFDSRLPPPKSPTSTEQNPGQMVSRTPAANEVANRVNNGWQWDGSANLVSPDGQTYPMNAAERQFMKAQTAKAAPKMLPEPPEITQLRNALRKMTVDEIADDLLADPSLEPAFKAAIGPQAWGIIAGRAAEIAAQRNGTNATEGDGYAAPNLNKWRKRMARKLGPEQAATPAKQAEPPARDLTGRTDTQLANLVASGSTPEIRAAAQAEIARRAQVGDINVVESNQAEAKRMPLSVGLAPGAVEPITVKNGVVHIGKYPAQDFDSGDDVAVPEGATDQQIVDALRAAGAISPRQHIFGLQQAQAAPGRRPSRMKPLEDGRIQQYAADLVAMAPNAGWAEEGGKLLRDANGNPTGRTAWIPRAEWFRAGMINSPSEVESAVQKAISGQPMSANEKRTVQGMMDWLDMINQAGDGANEELGAIEREGVYDFSEQAQDDVALGSEIDFDALPRQDEQAALRALGFNEEEANELTGREQGTAGRVRSAADEVSEADAGQVVEGRQGDLEGQGAGREAPEGFGLAGQTNEEAAAEAQARANSDEDALTRARIDAERDAAPFSLAQQSQPRPQGVQTGLFTADGRVSADAAIPPKDQGATAFAEGKERKAPESLSSANKVRWFVGYDEAKKVADGSAVDAADQAEAKPKKSSAEWLAEDGSDYENHVASDAEQLVIQVQEEYGEDDFKASDIPSVIADWAKDSRFKVEDLQAAFLKELDKNRFIPQKTKAEIRAALDNQKDDKYTETAARYKDKQAERAIVPLSEITVTRDAVLDGKPVEYDQKADEAISEIDNELTLAKQLLDCLAS